MNKEPEGSLTTEELLRSENIQLRREILKRDDTMLIYDIARARMLDIGEYSKTWIINNNRIEQIPQSPPLTPSDVASEIKASIVEPADAVT